MSAFPSFALIVPTRNRIAALDACLGGIGALDYPREQIQVIVVNDGDSEIPGALVRKWQRHSDVRVLSQENRGPGAARNLGASVARNEWLVFTDDDCVPASGWLSAFGTAAVAHPNAVLGGETQNGARENVYAEASQCLLAFLQEYYHRREGKRSQAAFTASNNLALARSTFDAVGGFDEHMHTAEDRDFCARLSAAGFPLYLVPGARVMHYRAMDLRGFWRQHRAYGSGAYYYHRNRARVGADDLRPEPLRFYTGMLSYSMQYAPRAALPIMLLIALSQAAGVYGFLAEVVRARLASDSVPARNSL